jgi:hypothetical protein
LFWASLLELACLRTPFAVSYSCLSSAFRPKHSQIESVCCWSGLRTAFEVLLVRQMFD